jgi:hypothetical protein
MSGCLRPSIWTATILKKILIVPLKATILKINIYYINLLLWCQAADLCKKPVASHRSTQKPVCTYLPPSCMGGEDRRRKVGGLTVPVACRRPYFLRSGQLSWAFGPLPNQFFSGSDRGCLWFYFKEAKDKFVTAFNSIRKFLNIVASHTEEHMHPPLCLFEARLSCQCPLKETLTLKKCFK